MNETQVIVTRILTIIAEKRSWYESPGESGHPLDLAIKKVLDQLADNILEEFNLKVPEGQPYSDSKSLFNSKKDSCI